MKTILNNLVVSVNALEHLSQEKMSGKLAYKISRNLRLINQELETYNKIRTGLLEEYGTLNEDKTQYRFEKNNQELFVKELTTTLDSEVELSIQQLDVSDLENINCTPTDLIALDWMIKPQE